MNIRRVKITDLIPDPKNARTHDERNLAAISASLKAFGQVEPLVVQKSTGKVIGGNGRLAAMLEAGETECDIHEVDIDDAKATALGIALNRTAELAEWDDQTLADLLASLPTADAAIAGFDASEIETLIASLAVSTEPAPLTLRDRFGAPPFSVLDARSGIWQDRKREWLATGIQSELGRGGGMWVESESGGPDDKQKAMKERERDSPRADR